MSRPVNARVHDEVAEWIEQQAENSNTTKGRIAEEILVEAYEARTEEKEEKSQESVEIKLEKDEKRNALVYEADNKRTADTLREMYPHFLHKEDDERLKEVRFEEDTPEIAIKEGVRNMP